MTLAVEDMQHRIQHRDHADGNEYTIDKHAALNIFYYALPGRFRHGNRHPRLTAAQIFGDEMQRNQRTERDGDIQPESVGIGHRAQLPITALILLIPAQADRDRNDRAGDGVGNQTALEGDAPVVQRDNRGYAEHQDHHIVPARIIGRVKQEKRAVQQRHDRAEHQKDGEIR